jgi:uncharacterized protein (TIGR00661 family)
MPQLPSIGIALAGFRLGHTMRMSRVILALRSLGHRVVVYTADEGARYLAETMPDVPLHTVPSLYYVQRQGRVDYLRTAVPGAIRIATSPWIVRRMEDELRDENVRLLLVDFEPFVSRAAKRLGIPRVSVNHQDVMRACHRPDRPSQAVSFAVVQTLIRCYVPRVDLRVISSFFRVPVPENVHLVGPVFRREVLAARERVETGDSILVYADPLVQEILMRHFAGGRERFVVFTDHPPAAPPPGFTFRPVGMEFVETLRTCKAVVASGGHQLSSEALLLGKPKLTVPQKGQYEERLNALYVEKTGGGRLSSHRSVAADLPDFLAGLPAHREALARLPGLPDFNLEDGTKAILDLLQPFCDRM